MLKVKQKNKNVKQQPLTIVRILKSRKALPFQQEELFRIIYNNYISDQ